MRRMRVAAAIVLVACGLLAVAVISASHPTSASAAASAPAVTTSSTSDVNKSNATLSGTVNPNGQSTTYVFEYGTTTSYGTQTNSTGVGSGNTPVGVHQAIFGLAPNTTYHYRLVATNATGTTDGADQTLTTPSTTSPTTITFETVPNPGRWRSGIHSSSTSAPTITTHVPTPRPNRRESP